MGTITITGAIVVITGWIALVEFDSFAEEERNRILQKIKQSPGHIMLIALMPIGIIINVLGSISRLGWLMLIGSTMIFLQGIIVSLLFWKRKRWKSIILLTAVIGLGIFIYIPLFI